MIEQISKILKENIHHFPKDDSVIFNNKIITIDKSNFKPVLPNTESKTIAFIDGGQAEIISAGNFSLSFIRIAAVVFKENKKLNNVKNEFYLLTTAFWKENDFLYESKIFPFAEKLIDENDLSISSQDSSIKTGTERAPIAKVASMARQFAEIKLASELNADFIILDGTLEQTFKNEERYLQHLPKNIGAIAKTSSLFTTSGNSPVVFINKIAPPGCWHYFVDDKTHFVKLHENAKHVFRFQGDISALPYLAENSTDAVFLGYPYGLMFADQMARVSNVERDSLRMNFLLRKENKEIAEYLSTTNAHEILDKMS